MLYYTYENLLYYNKEDTDGLFCYINNNPIKIHETDLYLDKHQNIIKHLKELQ